MKAYFFALSVISASKHSPIKLIGFIIIRLSKISVTAQCLKLYKIPPLAFEATYYQKIFLHSTPLFSVM